MATKKFLELQDFSDADLLVYYSQTARPLENGYEGFFLEELAPLPDREGTRLFRLLHKWAIEFINFPIQDFASSRGT